MCYYNSNLSPDFSIFIYVYLIYIHTFIYTSVHVCVCIKDYLKVKSTVLESNYEGSQSGLVPGEVPKLHHLSECFLTCKMGIKLHFTRTVQGLSERNYIMHPVDQVRRKWIIIALSNNTSTQEYAVELEWAEGTQHWSAAAAWHSRALLNPLLVTEHL